MNGAFFAAEPTEADERARCAVDKVTPRCHFSRLDPEQPHRFVKVRMFLNLVTHIYNGQWIADTRDEFRRFDPYFVTNAINVLLCHDHIPNVF